MFKLNAKRKMPQWAKVESDRNGEYIALDPTAVFPLYLKKMGEEPSVYSVAAARRCIVNDLCDIVGGPVRVRFLGPKVVKGAEQWSDAHLPRGPKGRTKDDAEAAGSQDFLAYHAMLDPAVDPQTLFAEFKERFAQEGEGASQPKHPEARVLCDAWLQRVGRRVAGLRANRP